MATKRHKKEEPEEPEEIVTKLRQVDVLVGQGMTDLMRSGRFALPSRRSICGASSMAGGA